MSSATSSGKEQKENCKKCDEIHDGQCKKKKLTVDVSTANEELLDKIVNIRFDLASYTSDLLKVFSSLKELPKTDQRALALAKTKLDEMEMWASRALGDQ